MESSELGNEVSGVQGSIHRQSPGNDEEGVGKLGHCQLLTGSLRKTTTFIEQACTIVLS